MPTAGQEPFDEQNAFQAEHVRLVPSTEGPALGADRGWFAHAPCTIGNIREDGDSVTLTTDGWGKKSYHILMSGIERVV